MLAILDYDAGNIESVRLALLYVGGKPEFVRDASRAAMADRIVFPGVGSAAQCMRNLHQRGFGRVLAEALEQGKPVLAICIGMQLLFDRSEEDEGVESLGILPGAVKKFVPPNDGSLTKIPHMGWNHVAMPHPHPLLANTGRGADCYFVHSYYVEPGWNAPEATHGPVLPGREPGIVCGTTEYAGITFTSMVGKGSLFATQFHPEKSGEPGLEMLSRFLQWDGQPC